MMLTGGIEAAEGKSTLTDEVAGAHRRLRSPERAAGVPLPAPDGGNRRSRTRVPAMLRHGGRQGSQRCAPSNWRRHAAGSASSDNASQDLGRALLARSQRLRGEIRSGPARSSGANPRSPRHRTRHGRRAPPRRATATSAPPSATRRRRRIPDWRRSAFSHSFVERLPGERIETGERRARRDRAHVDFSETRLEGATFIGGIARRHAIEEVPGQEQQADHRDELRDEPMAFCQPPRVPASTARISSSSAAAISAHHGSANVPPSSSSPDIDLVPEIGPT